MQPRHGRLLMLLVGSQSGRPASIRLAQLDTSKDHDLLARAFQSLEDSEYIDEQVHAMLAGDSRRRKSTSTVATFAGGTRAVAVKLMLLVYG